ncbi:MAG: FAD-dependent oxidoreductase, partial [Spirochaetaceae bacterium]|nr:FAD-dependent oxidoreductase [Spirochaetaceae bacterium]
MQDADLIIIGAGPAGLSAAQYGARANLKVLLLEQMLVGGQALNIDRLENYPGNATGKSGFELVQDLQAQAEGFGAVIINDGVLSIAGEEGGFALGLASGKSLRAPALILAAGALPRLLGVPGEAEFSGRGVSYCATCDGPFFKGKKVFVAGGGDSACQEAEYLAGLAGEVVMVHRKEKFRAQKALAGRVLHNEKIKLRFCSRITEIRGDKKVSAVLVEDLKTGTKTEEQADAVFIFVGSIPQNALVPSAEKDEAGYIITGPDMASSIPGIFVAGDLRSSPFRQVVVAAAEGAIAA